MNKVQKLSIKTLAPVLLLSSCGDMKSVVESPRVFLDPPYKAVENQQGADPLQEQQWALKKIEAAKAWEAGNVGTRRLTVAILSSGVDYNHEDLQGNLYVNKRELTDAANMEKSPVDKKDTDRNGYVSDLLGWDTVDSDGFPYDLLGDGTAAAGIIGALHNNAVGIKGLLKDVTILPVRYIDSSGAASVDRLIEAFKYLDAANPKPDVILVQVANVDFAGSNSGGLFSSGILSQQNTLKTYLDKWATADVPVVVSAGNRSSDVATVKSVISEFAKQPNVLIVTSADENDAKPFAANYSVRQVITAAPGVNVLSTAPGSQYKSTKGTFIAAAHVAGAVSLALSQHYGKITTNDLRTALLDKAASDEVPSFANFTLGTNRLNVGKFLEVIGASR